MSRQVKVTYLDDLDGSPAAEIIEFSLDGQRYEIDLSAENSKRLRELLARYIAAGRHVPHPERRTRATSMRRKIPPPLTDAERDEIWAWVAANPDKVPVIKRPRTSRLPHDFRAAYYYHTKRIAPEQRSDEQRTAATP